MASTNGDREPAKTDVILRMANNGGRTALDLESGRRRYAPVNADPVLPVGLEPDSRRALLRAGMKLSVLYWSVFCVLLTIVAGLENWDTLPIFGVRLSMTLFSIGLSWLIIRMVAPNRGTRFASKALLVCFVTVIAATAHHFVSFYAFRVIGENQTPMMLTSSLRNIFYWLGMYLGWSALYLALQYSAEVVERERQLSELRTQAHGAQMRALRYQINPHFLFNTLNALATLIEERDVGPAERMVISLSAFLRSTLALDPMQDITLAEELDIQARYLDIERERFSDRLTVEIDVPPEAARAKVPSLILQPLVENAVKHGVGALDRMVRIRIAAEAGADTLRIHVDNDAAEHARPSASTGVGLRNVAERLATRFGEAGRLTSGPAEDGHFRATVTLPLRHGPP